jgi:hypothetical protein
MGRIERREQSLQPAVAQIWMCYALVIVRMCDHESMEFRLWGHLTCDRPVLSNHMLAFRHQLKFGVLSLGQCMSQSAMHAGHRRNWPVFSCMYIMFILSCLFQFNSIQFNLLTKYVKQLHIVPGAWCLLAYIAQKR